MPQIIVIEPFVGRDLISVDQSGQGIDQNTAHDHRTSSSAWKGPGQMDASHQKTHSKRSIEFYDPEIVEQKDQDERHNEFGEGKSKKEFFQSDWIKQVNAGDGGKIDAHYADQAGEPLYIIVFIREQSVAHGSQKGGQRHEDKKNWPIRGMNFANFVEENQAGNTQDQVG